MSQKRPGLDQIVIKGGKVYINNKLQDATGNNNISDRLLRVIRVYEYEYQHISTGHR